MGEIKQEVLPNLIKSEHKESLYYFDLAGIFIGQLSIGEQM